MISTSINSKSSRRCFRLKSGQQAITHLELTFFEAVAFEKTLIETVAKAPGFFQQTPIIIDARPDCPNFPLDTALMLCRQYGLLPIAVRSNNIELQQQAQNLRVAILSPRRSTKSALPSLPEAHKNNSTPSRKDTVIEQPVRSGQQVYAQGGDLIVVGSVSAGAEVLADGNIHIYGALRGRALAGVKGAKSARVFCQSLEAELVSIAGTFILYDELSKEYWQHAVHIQQQQQALTIQPM
ncbi:Septum site-determining protein MinC [Sinobacterium norvegicum]|uniref:Probable septum site-determining protein MinC n=1 Tax=Sinobacterium norvegicum TaxID=1641715 RepID=A0ABN8ENE4_9GAMM|nr:septum site-determining protein MinC [Sinobacterium norvegicum]CAH0992482.1 Septum site-determining protein MinC [Sinobacterium norvegicum]